MKTENLIIYQMALRTFTPEGTLNAAIERLPYVKSLGVDIVYLCPVFIAENDENQETWSERQHASKTGNPKNPYKMYDYFHVDEEYGTDEDLKRFIDVAHELELMVFLDMVYLHCGKGAIFVNDNPDFIERNEDGSSVVGAHWPFARLNYKNPELRKYMTSNMEYFITEYNVDGFRCDVADRVPLDFWEEAFDHLRKIKPDLLTLNEGKIPEYIQKAFDWCYSSPWRGKFRGLFRGLNGVSAFRDYCIEERDIYGDGVKRCTRCVDNHDTASDVGLERNELVMTTQGVEAALIIMYTYDGIPFLWNGVEFCDAAENNMFSNRFYGKRSAMDWSNAFTSKGQKRTELVKKLHELHHNSPSITKGFVEWIDNDQADDIISYRKEYEGEELVVIVNAKNIPVSVNLQFNVDTDAIIMSYGAAAEGCNVTLEPYGYIVTKKNI